jgi:hypothetical protein
MLGWKNGTLTTEQAVGQILQLLQQMEERMKALERPVVHPKPPAKLRKRKIAQPA